MGLKLHTFFSTTALVLFVLSSPFANTAPREKGPGPTAVETFSGSFPDVQPDSFQQFLLHEVYPEIRGISVSLLANFSSLSGQWVSILYQTSSGGPFTVVTLYNLDGTQQFDTIEFNASEWEIRAFNNSDVNIDPISIDYTGTAIYSP